MNKTQQDLFHRAKEKCENGEFDKAIPMLTSLLPADTSEFLVLYNRAKAYYASQNFRASLKDFNEIISHLPNHAHYISERALVHFMNQSPAEALKDLDHAAALEPLKGYRYSSRAFIKDRLGDLKGALSDYEKAVELDPEDAISYNNKGLVEEKLGYADRAKKSFSSADKHDPIKDSVGSTSVDKIVEKSPEVIDPIDESVDIQTYGQQLKRLLTSSQEREEFKDFLLRLLRKINDRK